VPEVTGTVSGSLAFYKLWAFWSMILGGIVALLFALGLVRM
jgi:hypothetical protein